MDVADLIAQRKAKDDYFAHSARSPLEPHALAGFEGLDYFEPREDLVFTIAIEPGSGTEITIETSDGAERLYKEAGVVALEIAGEPVNLTLYDTGHPGLFLPFRDATSGKSTYGGGRYLDLEPRPDGTVIIDFNQAYNPLCVYSDGYSCPIPPVANWLEVPVEAGEKGYTRPG